MDYVCYELIYKDPDEPFDRISEQLSIVVKSLRKCIKRKKAKLWILKIKDTLEQAISLYIQIENETLTYEKVLNSLQKRMR